jgi:glycine betaine/proline transport system ATP-binding protein
MGRLQRGDLAALGRRGAELSVAGAPSPAAPAIACEDLWMVFGADAPRRLSRERRGDAAIAARNLREDGLIPAVAGVSFDVREGELFVIMGLSGSGKSTLVRCLSRLVEPTAGAVRIEGEDILAASPKRLIEMRRSKMGMVFQHFGLFPHMTVAENVAFPLRMQGAGVHERRRRAEEVIALVGLEGREGAYPRQLSGGQRQRVGIARSLAVNPHIWFLDEPFSALDPLIRRQLQDEFLRLQSSLKKSIVFITHDIGEALKLADRIMIMRDGRAVQIGTPAEIVLRPADNYVAEFARDLPRGRITRIAALMEPAGAGGFGTAPALSPDMTLEAALSVCATAHDRLPVTDAAGAVLGAVRADRLAAALGAEA